MTDLTARVETMAERATAERRAVFAALQAADPQQAAWLQLMAAEFGKPQAIRIKQNGKTYTRGEFTRG